MMRYDTLVRGLYAGIRAAQPFRDFLRDLAEATGGDAASIVVERASPDRPGAVFSGHLLEARRQAYAGIFGDDPFVGLPLNRAITMWEFLGIELFTARPFISRFLLGQGIQSVLGLDVLEAGGTRIRLRVTRRVGEPDFGPSEKALIERLGPHLIEASGLFAQLLSSQSRQDLYAAILNRLALGAVVVDRDGHVISITEKAEDILCRHNLLEGPAGNRRLRGGSTHSAEMFDALQRLTYPDRTGEQLWPIAVQGEGGEMLNLIIRPAHCRTRLDHPLRGTALLTISEASRPDAPHAWTLSRMFGLTPTEGELAALLAQGLDLDDASALLDISKNTAKTHLRMIFSKTRVSRQSSLVRLLLRSVDELTPGVTPGAAAGSNSSPTNLV